MSHEPYRSWVTLVDETSGLYNRLYLVHFLTESLARARRYGDALSCVLLRASWWRGIEEVRGPGALPAGALRELGRHLLRATRVGDILGRWSADTFLLVAPNTPPSGARVCTRNLLARAARFRLDEGGLIVCLRAGIAGLPDDEERVRYAEDLPLLARERLRAAPRGLPEAESGPIARPRPARSPSPVP